MMSKNESWLALFQLIQWGAKLMKIQKKFCCNLYFYLFHGNLNADLYMLLPLKKCWEILNLKYLHWDAHRMFSQIPNPKFRWFWRTEEYKVNKTSLILIRKNQELGIGNSLKHLVSNSGIHSLFLKFSLTAW